jgi:hypothetical protein
MRPFVVVIVVAAAFEGDYDNDNELNWYSGDLNQLADPPSIAFV